MDSFHWFGSTAQLVFRISIIIAIAIIIERSLRFFIGKFMRRSASLLNVDQTRYVFLKHAATATIYIIAIILIIYSIPRFRTLAVSLFAGAGILAAIIGFASQAAFSNIISGVFMVISRPFKVGDTIELQGLASGIVEDITLRHTVIRNYENKRIVVPNSKMSSEIIINFNLYDEMVRRYIDFSVDYNSDIDVVMKIMREECEKHPLCIDARSEKDKLEGAPKVEVRLIGFGESELKVRAYACAKHPADAFEMHTQLNVIIKKRFDADGISIPFPQRVISYRNEKESDPHQTTERLS
jgi:small conductance mechanosensitive channel